MGPTILSLVERSSLSRMSNTILHEVETSVLLRSKVIACMGPSPPYFVWLEDVLRFLRIVQQWVSLTPRHQVICRPLLLVDKRLLLTSLGHVSVEIESSFVKR